MSLSDACQGVLALCCAAAGGAATDINRIAQTQTHLHIHITRVEICIKIQNFLTITGTPLSPNYEVVMYREVQHMNQVKIYQNIACFANNKQ